MQHVFPLFERRLPKIDVLAHTHLRGLGLRTRRDARKKLLGRRGLVQIVQIDLAVHFVMKADVRDIVLGKKRRSAICGRLAGKHERRHGNLQFKTDEPAPQRLLMGILSHSKRHGRFVIRKPGPMGRTVRYLPLHPSSELRSTSR